MFQHCEEGGDEYSCEDGGDGGGFKKLDNCKYMAKINLIYSPAFPNQSGVKSHLTIRQIQFTTSSILQFQKTFLSHLTRK